MATAKVSCNEDNYLTTCTICLEQFNIPKYFPCLHTFCESCIATYISSSFEKDKTSIDCPVCRAAVSAPEAIITPEEWAKQMPLNFLIVGLIEKHKVERTEKICMSCERIDVKTKSKATSVCIDCSDALCLTCTRCHESSKPSSNHVIVPISDISKEGYALKSFLKNMCPEHKNKELELFCLYHGFPCCSICVSVKHRKCENVLTIEEAAQKFRESNSVSKTQNEVSSLLADFDTVLASERSLLVDMEANCNNEMQKCTFFWQNLQKRIDDLKNKSIKECQKVFDSEKSKLEFTIRDVENRKKEVTNTKQILEVALKEASDVQLMIEVQKLHKNIEKQLRNFETSVETYNIKIHFQRCLDDIVKIFEDNIVINNEKTTQNFDLSSNFVYNEIKSERLNDHSEDEICRFKDRLSDCDIRSLKGDSDITTSVSPPLGTCIDTAPSPSGTCIDNAPSSLGTCFYNAPSPLGRCFDNAPSPLGSCFDNAPSSLGTCFYNAPSPLRSWFNNTTFPLGTCIDNANSPLGRRIGNAPSPLGRRIASAFFPLRTGFDKTLPPPLGRPIDNPPSPLGRPIDNPSPPPLGRPIDNPPPPLGIPIDNPPPLGRPLDNPPPPLGRPIDNPPPPLGKPIDNPPPPLGRPIDNPPPPLSRPIDNPPPLGRPLDNPPPSLGKPIDNPPPPLGRPINNPPPPLSRPIDNPPPPLSRPIDNPPPLGKPIDNPPPPLGRPIDNPPPLSRPIDNPPRPLGRPFDNLPPLFGRHIGNPPPLSCRSIDNPPPPLGRPIDNPPPLSRPIDNPPRPLGRPFDNLPPLFGRHIGNPPPPSGRSIDNPPPPLGRPIAKPFSYFD